MADAAFPTGFRQWLVDAFTPLPFGGNAAMVVTPLSKWPSQTWMQRLAAENNVGATAFMVEDPKAKAFDLRWFTPATEVPLCGHATLAAAHVLVSELGHPAETINFKTTKGDLAVTPLGLRYEMALPALVGARPIPTPPGLARALGCEPLQVWIGYYLVALLPDAQSVIELQPDIEALKAISLGLGGQGNVGVAAVADGGAGPDVIDRFFAPGYGIAEDAATGSLHAMLTPILSQRLDRQTLRFRQAYPGRGAEFTARREGDHVYLQGEAVVLGCMELRLSPK